MLLTAKQRTADFLHLIHISPHSSLTSWPPRTPTPCPKSSHCHTSLTCSSCTTGSRFDQRKWKKNIWDILLLMGETCVIQVTHQSGATIEYSPVEALKRVCDIFWHPNFWSWGSRRDRILVPCTLCHEVNRVHPEPCISLGERQLGLSLLHCLPSSTHPPLLPLQMWQIAPHLTRQIPSEPYLIKQTHQVNDHEDLVTVSYAESWLVRYLQHLENWNQT